MKKRRWKRTLAAILVAACLPLSTPALAADAPRAGETEVSVTQEGDRVTIGNG